MLKISGVSVIAILLRACKVKSETAVDKLQTVTKTSTAIPASGQPVSADVFQGAAMTARTSALKMLACLDTPEMAVYRRLELDERTQTIIAGTYAETGERGRGRRAIVC